MGAGVGGCKRLDPLLSCSDREMETTGGGGGAWRRIVSADPRGITFSRDSLSKGRKEETKLTSLDVGFRVVVATRRVVRLLQGLQPLLLLDGVVGVVLQPSLRFSSSASLRRRHHESLPDLPLFLKTTKSYIPHT